MPAENRKAKTPSQRNPKRIGLSALQEERLRKTLRTRVPSEPWVDAQIASFEDVDAAGESIVYRFHNTRAFPPGGSETAMVRCPECGVFNPPNAMEHGLCLDHAAHQGWGPSPSAAAIRALQYLHVRVEQCELPSEYLNDLRREISVHQRKISPM